MLGRFWSTTCSRRAFPGPQRSLAYASQPGVERRRRLLPQEHRPGQHLSGLYALPQFEGSPGRREHSVVAVGVGSSRSRRSSLGVVEEFEGDRLVRCAGWRRGRPRARRSEGETVLSWRRLFTGFQFLARWSSRKSGVRGGGLRGIKVGGRAKQALLTGELFEDGSRAGMPSRTPFWRLPGHRAERARRWATKVPAIRCLLRTRARSIELRPAMPGQRAVSGFSSARLLSA